MLEAVLGTDGYMFVHAVLSPFIFGFPFAKERLYRAVINTETVEWIGPTLAGNAGHTAEIKRLFGRKVMGTGDMYFCASDEELLTEANARRDPKTAAFTIEDVESMNWKGLLSSGYQDIWHKYTVFCKENNLEGRPVHFDCRQNPGFGLVSEELRSFPTHSDIVSVQRQRYLIAKELLQVHGVPVFGPRLK